MPSSDEVIPVAFAMYHSPRRYALLVGSGISRDAEIPTAYEITDAFIRRIAGDRLKGNQKPQEWYEETYKGRSPTFTGLLDELTKSPEDRTAFLREYFEPKDREGNPIKVEPTPAHRSIARLVKDGIICMIITTNFDPLLEEAIKQETGSAPVVITPESRPERMDVAGDHCRIVKINGSYPDTSLKLTPADLAEYEADIAVYLDRIFSEYGLIVCGWSSEHDTGLAKILTADRTRRFAIFWCSREIPDKIPEAIRSKLNLSIIGIKSANEFFGDLELKINLISGHERISPLTVESAIKKVKDALRDSRPELILSDLVHEEIERILTEINRSDIFPKGTVDGKACFKNRVEDLEQVSSPLAAMIATITYYDPGNFSDLITETIDRLINLNPIEFDITGTQISGRQSEINHYLGYFQHLRLYPALLTVYSSGIAAIHKRNFNNLSVILERSRIRALAFDTTEEKSAFFDRVNMWYVLWTEEHWTVDFSLERFERREDAYFYLYKVIQGIVSPLIPHEQYYNSSFDIFECFFGICYVAQSSIDDLGRSYALLSRVKLRTAGFNQTLPMRLPASVHEYFQINVSKISESIFFGGQPLQFQMALEKYSKIQKITPPETGIHLPRGIY